MDQQNPNDPNSGLNPGSSGETGSGGMSSNPGFGSGGTGTGMSSGGGMTTGSGGSSSGVGGGAPIGVVSGSDADTFGTGTDRGGLGDAGATGSNTDAEEQYCTHCGHALSESKGLEQFLGRLGITGEMFGNLKGQFQNVDIDEYLNTAREYLKGSSTKVTNYTKENPAKVAAGVAALALGAGLIYAAVNRDKNDTTVAATGIEIQPDPNAGLNRGGDFDRDRGVNPGYDPNRT